MSNHQLARENALYQKWLRWIDQIYDEVVTLFLFRSYYRGLAEITESNDEIPPTSFFDALATWYGVTQTIAVRRQVDTDRRVVSMAVLLANMANNPGVMTRERHVDLYEAEEHWQKRANETFDKFAGAGAANVAAKTIDDDLESLKKVAGPIKAYVDKVIAHNDQKELEQLPTFEELNAAIDLLETLLNKYLVLLKATSLPSADPVHQEDWRDAFRVPWLKE